MKKQVKNMEKGNLNVVIIALLILLIVIVPGIAQELTQDTDQDGLSDDNEARYGTNPNLIYTDNDKLSDSQEIKKGTDALKKDTDNDGMIDGEDDFPLTARKIEVASDDDIKNIATKYAYEFPYEESEIIEETASKANIDVKVEEGQLKINIEDKAKINLDINKDDKTGIKKILIELPQ